MELGCRAFSHDSRTVQLGGSDALVSWLAEHATCLGIVKRWRQPHRARQAREAIMWGDPEVETGDPVLAPTPTVGCPPLWSKGPFEGAALV